MGFWGEEGRGVRGEKEGRTMMQIMPTTLSLRVQYAASRRRIMVMGTAAMVR